MKKWFIIICSLVILPAYLLYRDYYNPPFPLKSVSKNYVLEAISKNKGEIIKLKKENGYQWYISEINHGQEYENLKGLMKERGWSYKRKANAGLVFESVQGEIIVLSSIWNKKYILFHFPEDI